MKKLVFIFIALASTLTLMAQPPAEVLQRKSLGLPNIDHTIVRTNRITYYEEGGAGFFAYLNTFFGNYYYVKMPPNWSVRDFRVLEDTVYFCGIDNGTRTALLGHFGINNLVAGTGNITFKHDVTIGNYFHVLNRIAVGGKGKNISVMAIGRESIGFDPDSYGCDKVVYIENYAAGSGCIFRGDGSNPEVYWDVVATENYFTVAGTPPFPLASPSVYMRRALIGASVTAFLTNFSDRYEYNNYPVDDISGIRAAALEGDDVAFASYYKYYSYVYGNQEEGMQLLTVAVPTGQVHPYQRYSLLSYSMPWITSAPLDMVYIPYFRSLMVIDQIVNHIYPGNSILMLDPYSTTPPYSPYFTPYFENSHFSQSPVVSVSIDSAVCCIASYNQNPPYHGGWARLDLSIILPQYNTNGYYNLWCINAINADIFIHPDYPPDKSTLGDQKQYQMKLNDTTQAVLYNRHSEVCTKKNTPEDE